MYSEEDLGDLFTYLLSKDHNYIASIVSSSGPNSSTLEITLREKGNFNRKGKITEPRIYHQNSWEYIYNSLFMNFNLIPLALYIYAGVPKDILLWRLVRGV